MFGLNLSIFDLAGHLVTSYPVSNSPFCHLVKSNSKVLELCKNCDREAFDYVKKNGSIYIYRCHLGLYEACVPLYTYGIHSGFFMMGQTLTDTDYDRNHIKRKAKEYIRTFCEAQYLCSGYRTRTFYLQKHCFPNGRRNWRGFNRRSRFLLLVYTPVPRC